MADFSCPECGKALARRARKDGSGYFWSCTGYPDCKFIADDWEDEPFVHICPECQEKLRVRVSKKSGKPYIACMNKQKHQSQDAIFFNGDGTIKGDNSDRPKPKGEFSCPECGAPLKYFKFKKGKKCGEMGFGCFNESAHSSGRPLFFDDNHGKPVL